MKQFIEQHGATVTRIKTGRHIKAFCTAPDGRKGVFTFGWSESDHRAEQNSASRLKRFINQEGNS